MSGCDPRAGGTWVDGTIAGHRFQGLVFEDHAESDEYELENECRARVRLDCGMREVNFTDPYGQRRAFTASRINDTCWASTVLVEAGMAKR